MASNKSRAFRALHESLLALGAQEKILQKLRERILARTLQIDFFQQDPPFVAMAKEYTEQSRAHKARFTAVLKAYDAAAKTGDAQERDHIRLELKLVAQGALRDFDGSAKVWKGLAELAAEQKDPEPAPKTTRRAPKTERMFGRILAGLRKARQISGQQAKEAVAEFKKSPLVTLQGVNRHYVQDNEKEYPGKTNILAETHNLLADLREAERKKGGQ